MRKKSQPCGYVLKAYADFEDIERFYFVKRGRFLQHIDNENRIALGLFITNFKQLKIQGEISVGAEGFCGIVRDARVEVD